MFEDKDSRLKDFADLWIEDYGKDNLDLILRNKDFIAYLNEGGFFTAPASTKYHGAYEGGLYDHSRAVFLRLRDLTDFNGLRWQRQESPFIIGMFHDLCKCDQYKKVQGIMADLGNGNEMMMSPESFHYEYNTNTLLKGHGDKSVMILSQFITLTEEEMLCIRYHMGAYEKDDWQFFDAAIRKTNGLALYTHTADMLASKVDNI